MKIDADNGIKIIAFPAINTGVYHFPLERAVKIASNETKSFLQNNSIPEKVIFVCFDDKTYDTYLKMIGSILNTGWLHGSMTPALGGSHAIVLPLIFERIQIINQYFELSQMF